MKKFFEEFRAFITKGDVMNLAVGVIIGAAFKDIVTSLTDNIIQPILDLVIKTDFGAKVLLKGSGDTAVYLNYGAFITAVINFLIMALVIFFMVKILERAQDVGKKLLSRVEKKKEEEPATPTTKICPFCKSEIDIGATRCPHCTSIIPVDEISYQ